MNSYSTTIIITKMLICYFHKLFYNMIWRSGSINKEKLIVFDIIIQKCTFVIFFFIQSDNTGNIKFLENFNVFDRMMTISLISISFINRTHKRHELSWYYPVYITVFYSLIKFIFFYVKSSKIIPLEF